MKRSWFGLGIPVALGLLSMLSGCSSTSDSTNAGSSAGTNTGNGTCAGQSCAYPQNVSGDDGTVYGGSLYVGMPEGTAELSYRGGSVVGNGTSCQEGGEHLELVVPLLKAFATRDGDGNLRVRWTEQTPDSGGLPEADLTIKSDRKISGTVSAPINGGDILRRLTLNGTLSLECPSGSVLDLPLADGTSFPLDCVREPLPSGLAACHDVL